MNANQSIDALLGLIGVTAGFLLFFLPVLMRWRQLARRFPDRAFVAESTFAGLSGTVVRGIFRSVVRLELGEIGLRLSVPWPFRLLFPAFVIPWAAVTSCCREQLVFSPNALRIDVAEETDPIHLKGFLWRHGDAVTTILDYWHEHHTNIA